MHTLKYLCNQEISIEIFFFQECPGKMIRKAPIQQGIELTKRRMSSLIQVSQILCALWFGNGQFLRGYANIYELIIVC